jgi:DMSO/TMAO reductase YedYZ heme-binding membrane subunit
LADIFTKIKWIRPLVILRKGAGVFSASIVVSFIISKLMMDPSGYINSIGTIKYWSLVNLALLAHLADISAVILIITSNNLSKRILGTWWKKIQRLSYVYFYASVLYVYLTYGDIKLLFMLLIVTLVTYLASAKNNDKLLESYKSTSTHTSNQMSIRDTLPIKNKIRSI